MNSKSLLIAIAAFAVTATGVSAYGGVKLLDQAGFTSEQVQAMEEARELRGAGDYTAARDILVEAGITEDALRSMHRAATEVRSNIQAALGAGDYGLFKTAVADSPIADIVTSEADFLQFKEAHDLRQSGETEQAREIMAELGFDGQGHRGMFGGKKGHKANFMKNLTDDQREALIVARQSNDRDTIEAIREEAGVERDAAHRMKHQR